MVLRKYKMLEKSQTCLDQPVQCTNRVDFLTAVFTMDRDGMDDKYIIAFTIQAVQVVMHT